MLALCTNRKSKPCASASGACRHAGIAWLCGTIRAAGHGDEPRGAKVAMPTRWRHVNLRVWYPLRSAVDDASFLEWCGIVNVLAHADPRQAVSNVARIGVAQCKDT